MPRLGLVSPPLLQVVPLVELAVPRLESPPGRALRYKPAVY
jgi:hypothetical protein